jgi:hypothetical protein
MTKGVEDPMSGSATASASASRRAAADSLLGKIRTFVAEELDDQEAALFAALVAPGVARAHRADGVVGDVDWEPGALPDSLAEAVRDGGIRVEGLDAG